MLGYGIDLTPDDNGTFLATSPDFPEVTTFGKSEDDACARAVDAIEEAIAGRMQGRQTIRHPSTQRSATMFGGHFAPLSTTAVLKIGLYNALMETGMSRADLTRALGWHREQVDRLFRLDHASKIDQIEAALAKLGKGIDVEIRSRTAA